MRGMKICAVAMRMGRELRELGHEVVDLWPEEPLFDLEAELQRRAFTPELIFQEERLGRRVVLLGLPRFSCPKVFWSLDTHLSLYWQRFYLRLFDGVLTPHASLLARRADMPPAVGRMAMYAQELPFIPFARRTNAVGFVGRLTPQRPARLRLAELLAARYGAVAAQDLPFADMLAHYQNTRLAPNESLLGEVNFRLMEAAGCGCLVLSPDVGPDQDALFTPGREMETYAHALELRARIDHYLARPEEAERMGRAAWERVRGAHLARHRAARVLDFAVRLPGVSGAARGAQAEIAMWLALAEMWRGGMLDAGDGALESTLALLPQGAEVSAERLILATEAACRDAACRDVVGRDAVGADGGGRAFALGMAGALLSAGAHAGDLDVDLAGSMAGVLLDDFALARRFWLRRVEAARSKRGEEREPRPAVPQTPAQLCRWWAGELAAAGRVGSDGFAFDPEASSPRAALECLHLALRLEPDDLDTVRRLEALAATLPGRDHLRLAHLSTLALHAPGDWRVGLKLGLAGLKTFRLEAGLADIAKARADADAQGKAEAFARTLAALDSKGLVAAEFAAPCG